METADLQHRFQFHPADDENRQEQHQQVRETCLVAANAIDEVCDDSREKSLAITKLEEAMFWANAAIARQDGPKT
jgi:hypothetical protein